MGTLETNIHPFYSCVIYNLKTNKMSVRCLGIENEVIHCEVHIGLVQSLETIAPFCYSRLLFQDLS